MIRTLLAALVSAGVMSSSAFAYDATRASRYASPDMYRPNVDGIIFRGPNSSGPIDGTSVTAPGGSIALSLKEWLSARFDVRGYTLNGDLAQGFAAACAAMPASGGQIYIPRRQWNSGGALVCNDKPVGVGGDGPGVSVVNFTSAAVGKAGLSLAPGNVLRPITISDFSLIAGVNQINGNAAITLRYPSAPSNIFKGPRVTNVEIAGVGNNTTYWGKGIDAYNIWGFDFHGNHIRGMDVGSATSFPSANMGAAISVTGENGGGCSDGKIQNNEALFAKYLGYVSGDCEGLHWTDNVGVAIDQGIVWPNAKAHPGFFISRNHVNVFTKGFAISGAVQGTINDNLIYKWANSAQDFAGISFLTYSEGGATFFANNNIAHHNTIVGYAGSASQGGKSIGIDASGGDGNLLQANAFVNNDWNFDLGNIPSTNTVADNTATGTVEGWQRRLGLNTISRNNTPVNAGKDVFYVPLTGGGSVNVGAWFQKVFLSADGSPTTYNDFTNAEVGRQITIIGQNGMSTIVNNSRIHLKGGANFTTSQSSSLTLLYLGDYWQEIGRSQ